MKHIRKITDYAMVGGLGSIIMFSMAGCEHNNQNIMEEASNPQGAFVIIEEVENGSYKIIDEYPSATNRIILKKLDGSERILSQEEMDALVKAEAKKIDEGTSSLTQPSISGGGMGLGEVLLASMAGAAIGSWIGGKLFNNQNFKQRKQASYKSPQTYSKSVNSFKKTNATSGAKSSSSKKGGFFGGGQKTQASGG